MWKKMNQIVQHLLANATNQGYKSNVIKPIMWLMIIPLLGSIVCFYYKLEFLGYLLSAFTSIAFLASIGAYLYCLYKNPDWLRSEKYNLEKTAMQTFINNGDSVNGHPQIRVSPTDYVDFSSTSRQITNQQQNEGEH